MICPFAGDCPGLEAFARESMVHLAWAFCLGEYRDCDRYKERVAQGDAGASPNEPATENDAVLGRLRADLRYRP
jgi:hypothetical protein